MYGKTKWRRIAMRMLMIVVTILAAACMIGCGTLRGSIDAAGHLGSGVIRDCRAIADGIGKADRDAARKGLHHPN